jgi:hypothetical protein
MDTLTNLDTKPPRSSKGLAIGAVIGIIAIALAAYYISQQPSMDDQIAAIMEGSYREGSPEFEELARNIRITTSQDTVESPDTYGTISMYIRGRITNNGDRPITVLEVKASVVDLEESVIREGTLLVVPRQANRLDPGETVIGSLTIQGFAKSDDRANIRWAVTAIKPAS